MARTKPGRAARRGQSRVPLAKAAGLAAALLLLASGCLWLIGARPPAHGAVIGGPFELIQGDGRPVTDRSFRGKYLLIYFGYTACEDVCPTTLATVAAALDSLGERADLVQPLFITVDPERDTPAVVQRYAALFTPRLVGLTGSPAGIRKVADEYRVSRVARHGGADPARHDWDHSAVIYMVGLDGRYIAPIRADATADAMAKRIAGYLPS